MAHEPLHFEDLGLDPSFTWHLGGPGAIDNAAKMAQHLFPATKKPSIFDFMIKFGEGLAPAAADGRLDFGAMLGAGVTNMGTVWDTYDQQHWQNQQQVRNTFTDLLGQVNASRQAGAGGRGTEWERAVRRMQEYGTKHASGIPLTPEELMDARVTMQYLRNPRFRDNVVDPQNPDYQFSTLFPETDMDAVMNRSFPGFTDALGGAPAGPTELTPEADQETRVIGGVEVPVIERSKRPVNRGTSDKIDKGKLALASIPELERVLFPDGDYSNLQGLQTWIPYTPAWRAFHDYQFAVNQFLRDQSGAVIADHEIVAMNYLFTPKATDTPGQARRRIELMRQYFEDSITRLANNPDAELADVQEFARRYGGADLLEGVSDAERQSRAEQRRNELILPGPGQAQTPPPDAIVPGSATGGAPPGPAITVRPDGTIAPQTSPPAQTAPPPASPSILSGGDALPPRRPQPAPQQIDPFNAPLLDTPDVASPQIPSTGPAGLTVPPYQSFGDVGQPAPAAPAAPAPLLDTPDPYQAPPPDQQSAFPTDPAGTKYFLHPESEGGGWTSTYPDGTQERFYPDGTRATQEPQPQSDQPRQRYRTRIFDDGTQLRTGEDGNIQVRNSQDDTWRAAEWKNWEDASSDVDYAIPHPATDRSWDNTPTGTHPSWNLRDDSKYPFGVPVDRARVLAMGGPEAVARVKLEIGRAVRNDVRRGR